MVFNQRLSSPPMYFVLLFFFVLSFRWVVNTQAVNYPCYIPCSLLVIITIRSYLFYETCDAGKKKKRKKKLQWLYGIILRRPLMSSSYY